MEKDKAHKAWRNEGKLDGECTGGRKPWANHSLKRIAAPLYSGGLRHDCPGGSDSGKIERVY
ncbi:hypothetical protein B4098_0254 [Heyndrickxia coagulans]|uniref:Uncharacterized protein n=1 Tax=Heyndrickxia coagulans TaxID=1398 RepID=A0A150K7E4_HEYCO|nr:hypothetical protein B4098_0254 [Heyndrickxia coagulans]